MSREDVDRIIALLYLYFDALEYRVSVEMDNIANRLLHCPNKITYDEAVKLLQLHDKLEIMRTIDKELHELLDSMRHE